MKPIRSRSIRALCRPCIAAALLAAATGCKPTPPAGTAQATPPTDSSAPRQPTASDFQVFFQPLLPAEVKISGVKIDPPVRMPNTSSASNVWLVSTKMTFTPTEDMLSLPSTEDTKVVDDLVGELNRLVDWRNTYFNTPYAKACGGLEIKVSASPTPQLLVVSEPKNQPLPPIYGQVSAEWQVDHWLFTSVDMTLPKSGYPRSHFQGATMVKGSPEADKVLGSLRAAITQARKDIEAIRSRYADQIAKGTKPGAIYKGTVSYGPNVLPCELRLLDPPPGGDARFASVEVTLTSLNPPCWYIYKARVTTELPIPVPGAQPTSANPYAVTGFNDSNPVPSHNVFQKIVRSSNYKVGRDTLPAWLSSNDHGGQALLLLDGRIEGTINDFGAFPGIQISVNQISVER